MFSIIKKIFQGTQKEPVREEQAPTFRKSFEFLIVERGEEIEKNRWYRMSHWQSPHFLKMETEWDKDWKGFAIEEEVVGVTYDNRAQKFLELGDQNNFSIFLERDPNNPHDKNAIKVMGSAIVDGKKRVEQLGFLSKDTAKALKNEKEIDARPFCVYLPYQESKFGLRVRILVRSQKYKDKHGIETKVPRSKAEKSTPEIKEKDFTEDIIEEILDPGTLEAYNMKKPSKKLIKEAIDKLKKEGMSVEEQFDSIEEVVEMILELKPDLEKDY
jgi:hypothetical protein